MYKQASGLPGEPHYPCHPGMHLILPSVHYSDMKEMEILVISDDKCVES